jgi:diketogulonate reductase-like aldo/keto reductase
MVNQVEYHPLLQQKELLQFCKEHRIQLEGWRPLMLGNSLDHPVLTKIAAKYGKTPAQVVLRWELQQGVIVIPKSVNEHRIRENADIFDFELTSDDEAQIETMNQNKRFGPDPDNFNF